MSEDPPPGPGKERLAENVVHFARALRTAGLPVGPERVIDALNAVELAGVQRRDDFYWTLHALFVDRHENSAIFEEAFQLFWRNPAIMQRLLHSMLPQVKTKKPPDQEEVSQRVAQALQSQADEAPQREEEQIEMDARLTVSEQEKLQTRDFDSMSAQELAEVKQALKRMRLPIRDIVTRRYRPSSAGGRVDPRATLRASLRGGGNIALRYHVPRRRPPALVVLCDISGSMSRYSRVFLHFMHAVTNDRDHVHTLLFGTQLTNITRYLRDRDVDAALARIGHTVEDWSGGTRIGGNLHAFNRDWSRRLLSQGAVVMLMSDGLDRDTESNLRTEMARLQRSSLRLIWLNPLLRYQDFEPRATGIREMLPYVDDFRPVHNLQSLSDLTEALARRPRAAA
jgi:uncharacterized protein with von Willebrand factor type A (vWA) domain